MHCTNKIIAKGTLRNLRSTYDKTRNKTKKKKINQQIFFPSLSGKSQKSLCQTFLTGDKAKEVS